MHPGIQVGGSVTKKNLEHSHSVRSNSRMQRCSTGVVLRVGISSCIQQSFCSICACIASSKMKGCLPSLVHCGIQFGTLGYQICYDCSCSIFFFIFTCVHPTTTNSCHHKWCHPTWATNIHVLGSIQAWGC